ncbi:MerR family transcriptional regulator [Paractinoplanes deccanensis]|uniref:MerR family transcriptional regulator n=1 Tax=Paractinoplanes deccanensis TaxID=113561 RepID=A0ABQ3YIJ2_9ACTN|nr:MerR family transcriptional regulator [Actinoplanes deccanensis]GID79787.1 MerR family transcriptional regulator [Actinoplanes deccanensis]
MTPTGARPLTIHEMSRRSGFSEATLRYYERIGLLGAVERDRANGHRRYGPATADRVEALACLRSSGMTVEGLRRYVRLLARGDEAAGDLRQLFADQAGELAAEIDRLRVRHEYLTLKAQLWDARSRRDRETEADVVARVEKTARAF